MQKHEERRLAAEGLMPPQITVGDTFTRMGSHDSHAPENFRRVPWEALRPVARLERVEQHQTVNAESKRSAEESASGKKKGTAGEAVHGMALKELPPALTVPLPRPIRTTSMESILKKNSHDPEVRRRIRSTQVNASVLGQ